MKNVNTSWVLLTVLRIVAVFVLLVTVFYCFVFFNFSNDINDSIEKSPQSGDEFVAMAAGFWSIVVIVLALLFVTSSIITIVLTSRKLKKLKLQSKA